ncbi:CheR family methyltransferase [Aureispira anguillae]|uniref:Protein-glutamate O-methyltransferase CheR n=1 Tax=Aureispira anguillae TaxID=2864201 RepID=A0A915YB15_9BACT|nr:protein-glutamate O-methyltransferase CheR [Aureispira anguillae]BDS09784.1 protein-glutamate O-methyltransferase CheR [Aureispira anguillae]
MTKQSQRLQITDEELEAFTLAVKTRFGLDFTSYEKKSLKRGLVRLISKQDLKSMIGLWSKMLRDKTLIVSYIDELLVNLTEFFRNYDLWQKLKDEVLKKIWHHDHLTFWHAGCSTGEEIYTMAIVLKESFMLHKAQTLATDLSSKALAQAIEGKYNTILWNKYMNSYALYNPKGNGDRYFTKGEQVFYVREQLKKHVRFQRHNLVQDEMKETFKVIFCRNVMIYFDNVLKMKVLELFYDALEDDGFFIIGYYDMLPYESREMFTLYCPSTRIYTKNLNYKKENA